MAVRTRRLGTLSVATGGGGGATTVVFTCPANRTAILKDIRLNASALPGGGAAVVLDVNLAAGVSRGLWAWLVTALGSFSTPDTPWIVLEEGDELRVAQPASTTLQGYFSGTLLEGDPE